MKMCYRNCSLNSGGVNWIKTNKNSFKSLLVIINIFLFRSTLPQIAVYLTNMMHFDKLLRKEYLYLSRYFIIHSTIRK